MTITIHNFEQHISKIIAERGLDYYEDDLVENLVLENGKWIADVYGTDDYEVEVRIEDDGNIQGWMCDCPYDHGPICKHTVATLLAIRAEWDERVSVTESLATDSKSARKKPIAQIIDQLDEIEMRKLLTYFAQRHNEVRAYLLTNYANVLETVSKAQYVQLVKSVIDANGGRRGYLDYRESTHLGNKVNELLEDTNPKESLGLIYLCEAIIEQLTEVINHADDSSGSLGGALSGAFDMLHRLAEPESELPAPLYRHIFEYAIRESQDPKYKGWDWVDALQRIAVKAVRKPLQAEQLIAVLDRHVKKKLTEDYGQYGAERGQKLKYQLLKDFFSAEKAAEFLQQNLGYTSFRTIALEQALADQQYDTVKRLAMEGIELDTNRKHPGTVNQWKKWLIRLAEATGDTAALVQTNEELFLDRGDMNYYREIKKLLSSTDFAKKIEQYLAYFRERNRRFPNYFNSSVANILMEERRWEDLMTEVKKGDLSVIDH